MLGVGQSFLLRVPRSMFGDVLAGSNDGLHYEHQQGSLLIVARTPGDHTIPLRNGVLRVQVLPRARRSTWTREYSLFDGAVMDFSARRIKHVRVFGPKGVDTTGAVLTSARDGRSHRFIARAAGEHHIVMWSNAGAPMYLIMNVSKPGVYPDDVEVVTMRVGERAPLKLEGGTGLSHRADVVALQASEDGTHLLEAKSPGYSTVTLYPKGGPSRTIVYHVQEASP